MRSHANHCTALAWAVHALSISASGDRAAAASRTGTRGLAPCQMANTARRTRENKHANGNATEPRTCAVQRFDTLAQIRAPAITQIRNPINSLLAFGRVAGVLWRSPAHPQPHQSRSRLLSDLAPTGKSAQRSRMSTRDRTRRVAW